MGWIACPNDTKHFRKWDQEHKDVPGGEWILVSRCYHCGDPPYWEVYSSVDLNNVIDIKPYEESLD